jgi:hypothetical protein
MMMCLCEIVCCQMNEKQRAKILDLRGEKASAPRSATKAMKIDAYFMVNVRRYIVDTS